MARRRAWFTSNCLIEPNALVPDAKRSLWMNTHPDWKVLGASCVTAHRSAALGVVPRTHFRTVGVPDRNAPTELKLLLARALRVRMLSHLDEVSHDREVQVIPAYRTRTGSTQNATCCSGICDRTTVDCTWVDPIARGGSDTTDKTWCGTSFNEHSAHKRCQSHSLPFDRWRSSAGDLHSPGSLHDWDGLLNWFMAHASDDPPPARVFLSSNSSSNGTVPPSGRSRTTSPLKTCRDLSTLCQPRRPAEQFGSLSRT